MKWDNGTFEACYYSDHPRREKVSRHHARDTLIIAVKAVIVRHRFVCQFVVRFDSTLGRVDDV